MLFSLLLLGDLLGIQNSVPVIMQLILSQFFKRIIFPLPLPADSLMFFILLSQLFIIKLVVALSKLVLQI
jgi:hypothetical protein